MRTYPSLSCDSNLNWVPVLSSQEELRRWTGESENSEVKILFRSAVCSRVTQGTRASVSHLTELCGATLKQAPVCLVCSAQRDEKQSLAICSHFRRSLGFLKSRPEQWNSALPYQKSSLGAAASHLRVYCSIVQPSPALRLSVYLPRALLLILRCWLSFSLCGAFLLFCQIRPVEAWQLVHHSTPLPPRGRDAWKVGWPARGRVALLSDADAQEWSPSRIGGVADCSQTCVCLNPPQKEEPSSSLLFFKAE